MGAPPGAPGAIEGAAPTTTPDDLETRPRPGQPDVTPRARFRTPRATHRQGAQHKHHPERPSRDEDILLSLPPPLITQSRRLAPLSSLCPNTLPVCSGRPTAGRKHCLHVI